MAEIILCVVSVIVSAITLVVVIILFFKQRNKVNGVTFDSANEIDEKTLNILEEKIANKVSKVISDGNHEILEKVSDKFYNMNKTLERDLQSTLVTLSDFQMKIQKDLQKSQQQNNDSINSAKDKMAESVNKLNAENLKTIKDFQTTMLNNFDEKIEAINKVVDERLAKGFEVNSNNLEKVNVSLGKITEAQNNLDKLSAEVTNLNNVLTNSQKRGRFGEIALESVLFNVFGDTRDAYYLQKNIDNTQVRPDAMIVLPEPDNLLCIDSKFSFVAYEKLFNSSNELSDADKKKIITSLKDNLKAQITKIAKDYIISGKTCEYAIMFIPNDGIYAFIQTDDVLYENVVKYSRSKNVVLTSPSTLQPILATLNTLRVNYEMSKNIKKVVEEIHKVSDLNKTFAKRWDNLYKSISSLTKKSDEFNISVNKIEKKTSNVVSIAVKNKIIGSDELINELNEDELFIEEEN